MRSLLFATAISNVWRSFVHQYLSFAPPFQYIAIKKRKEAEKALQKVF